MDLFDSDKVNFDLLKSRAFNLRWAELPDDVIPLTAVILTFKVHQKYQRLLLIIVRGSTFHMVLLKG